MSWLEIGKKISVPFGWKKKTHTQKKHTKKEKKKNTKKNVLSRAVPLKLNSF